jgi:site-specific DNA recombinase
MKARAAIYTRVSTLDQRNGASLHTQKTDCLRYCQASGLLVVAEFQDLQSGLNVDRLQYQEMLRQAETGAFDVIVVWKLDRFGRDRVESGYQLRELQKIGVRVDSATEPNDSPLLRNILMGFAEEESRRISLRVSANKRTLAQQGKRSSKAPFGYRNVGGRGACTLEPDEDAEVVTEVFRMYASGKHSLADLRDYINRSSGSPNRPKTRAGLHFMLKNPVYVGSIRHGFWARSKIQIKSKDERLSEVFNADGLHKPLIDQATFQKVQDRLQSNRPQSNGRPHSAFLFTGLVRCSCGYRYTPHRTGSKSVAYYCTRKNDAGDCNSRSVNESLIRAKVIPPIEKLLAQLRQEDIRAEVRQQLMEYQKNQRSADQAAKQGVSDRLGRLEKRLTTWLEMVGDGEMSREQYAKLRAEYEPQIGELKKQLAERPHLALPNVEQVLAIADTITLDSLDDLAWRDIIEGMVDRIVIERAEGDGKKTPTVIRVVWKPAYKSLLNLVAEG